MNKIDYPKIILTFAQRLEDKLLVIEERYLIQNFHPYHFAKTSLRELFRFAETIGKVIPAQVQRDNLSGYTVKEKVESIEIFIKQLIEVCREKSITEFEMVWDTKQLIGEVQDLLCLRYCSKSN